MGLSFDRLGSDAVQPPHAHMQPPRARMFGAAKRLTRSECKS